MVDQIPSKYGVSIIQKWKHFVAIPIAGRQAALAVFIALNLVGPNKNSFKKYYYQKHLKDC